MMDERLIQMLCDADRTAGTPHVADAAILAGITCRRAHARKIRRMAIGIGAAATIAILATMAVTIRIEQQRIEHIQRQIAELTERTDATVAFVKTILEEHDDRQKLVRLNQQLASISDPIKEIQNRVDETAFAMLYQADMLYKQLNLKESAVQAYQRVIELFPDNRWAETARERIKQIEEQLQIEPKGDVL